MNKITLFSLALGLFLPMLTNAQTNPNASLEKNIKNYMRAWSIESNEQRLAVLQHVATPDFTYKDPTSAEMDVNTVEKTSEWIAGFHEQMRQFGLMPIRGELISNIEMHGKPGAQVFRFNWRITANDGAVVLAEGVDFGTSRQGQLSSITGFFGKLTPKCEAPLWQTGAVYLGGQQVTFQNAIYQANWWVDNAPDVAEDAWKKLNDCVMIEAIVK
ncbi:hypothetical protein ACSLBF_01885 [Pseudoalteromonas sp. T1lg65]|uniref:hypothetical protein n=1 Tax=Pseudoalteromonas sp. T1lg65 TaxID=2077101 RepID=UPI003F7933F3